MPVFIHELKSNKKMLLVWSLAVGGLIFLMMLLYPSMKDALTEAMPVYEGLPEGVMSAMMGDLNVSTPMGFYGIEAGFMLSLGGALFGALLGAGMLAKEEGEHTAEFLLTTPVGRNRVVVEKFLAMKVLILTFNLICILFAVISFAVLDLEIGEGFWLYHLAQFIMHLQVACICFGISAFMKRSSMGIGLGVALMLYFASFFSGVSERLEFLDYLTPFKYAEAGSVIPENAINTGMLGAGIALAVIALVVAFVKYTRKDIAA